VPSAKRKEWIIKMLNLEMEEKIKNVETLLKDELSTIINLKTSAENDKKYLMNSLETLSNDFNTNSIIEESYMLPQLFKSLNDSIAKTNSNLLILKNLETNINSILFTISMQISTNTMDINDLNNQLNMYNVRKQETKNDILNNSTYVQKFIASTKTVIDSFVSDIENSKENIIRQFKENKANATSGCGAAISSNSVHNTNTDDKTIFSNQFNTEEADLSHDNNTLYTPYKIQENDTLLISEKQEKVFLPYTLSDLSEFTKDTEKSLEDVVRENFVVSLHTFKNPTISRFKAAYNLARNKSNYSLLKSFNFAVEIMFKYNLNPAIILACKTVDELKDYLNCLKEQKLDLFKPFKIKYEMNPMKI